MKLPPTYNEELFGCNGKRSTVPQTKKILEKTSYNTSSMNDIIKVDQNNSNYLEVKKPMRGTGHQKTTSAGAIIFGGNIPETNTEASSNNGTSTSKTFNSGSMGNIFGNSGFGEH